MNGGWQTNVVLGLALVWLGGAAQGAALSLSQQPLFITSNVGPNLFVTLDNSTSMQMAVVPDASNINAIRPTRRAKSATFNSLYYNPAVVYQAPYAVTFNASTGTTSRTRLSTSFGSAYVNGYRPGLGAVNLLSDYRVSWSYNPNLITTDPNVARGSTYGNPGLQNNSPSMLAENPTQDFYSNGTYQGTSNAYSRLILLNILVGTGFSETINGAQVSISDPSLLSRLLLGGTLTGGCTASIANTSSVTYSNVTCTRNVQYGLLGTINSASYTVTANTSTSATIAGVPAYYYIYDTTLVACTTASIQAEGCYRRVWVTATSGLGGTDERQNFANWYSFYRSRALAAQSATNLALADASENLRLGWQALGDSDSCILITTGANCRGIASSSTNAYDNRLRPFSGAHRAAFFTWLGDVYYNQSTPLLQAVARVGELLKVNGKESPYAFQPGSGETPVYGCRASYSLVVTDGVWNAPYTSGNYDGSSKTLPDEAKYQAQPPFMDGTANTLADLAFLYWSTDAQPNLANRIPAYQAANDNEVQGSNTLAPYWNPRNDPATWQHLTGFYVGIGLSSALTNPAWAGSTYAGGYAGIAAGTTPWPVAGAEGSVNQNNVYDLWHAAINSRGGFFSAESASDLIASLGQVITRISQSISSGAQQAQSPIQGGSDDKAIFTYKASFSSGDWSGDLAKYRRTTKTQTLLWSAAQKLDEDYPRGSTQYTDRPVYMAANPGLKRFSWSNLSVNQQNSFGSDVNGSADGYGEARANYVRGDRSKESSSAVPALRSRSHLLGDIVNSAPIVVGEPDRPIALMNALVDKAGSYTAFRNKYAKRSKRIYVGANDGMLHAFDDLGKETFAFIPSAVIGKLAKLTDRSYTGGVHQFYVDGSPVQGDVYFNNDWHTVLIGTLRGGGRSVFALDITDPNNIQLLWERTVTDTEADVGYENLGFTYAKPVIARLHTGRWGVLLANGYNSKSDNAVLHIIDVETGKAKALVADDGGNAPNGLGTPYMADIDGDLIADYAYAGDLRGNLWRFDLISPSGLNAVALDGDLKVAFNGRPLYSARASSVAAGTNNLVQPITAAPQLLSHPSGIGHLVLFGTGKYLETSDAAINANKAMSIYGIWDRQTERSDVITTTIATAKLQQQTLGGEQRITYTSLEGNLVSAPANTVSSAVVNWYDPVTNPSGKLGWYLNLPLNGEQVINPAKVDSSTLQVSSVLPNQDPCSTGVTTYLYVLDAYTGGSNNNFLKLGLDSVYSRLQVDGLLGGIVPFSYPGGTLAIGGTLAGGSLAGESKLENTVERNGLSSRRQTWRVITNQD